MKTWYSLITKTFLTSCFILTRWSIVLPLPTYVCRTEQYVVSFFFPGIQATSHWLSVLSASNYNLWMHSALSERFLFGFLSGNDYCWSPLRWQKNYCFARVYWIPYINILFIPWAFSSTSDNGPLPTAVLIVRLRTYCSSSIVNGLL